MFHLDAAVAAASDDDARLLAEYHFVRGNFASMKGQFLRAEAHLRAAAEVAEAAEAAEAASETLAPSSETDAKPSRLAAAAARAALADIHLHSNIERLEEELAEGARLRFCRR